MDMNYQLHAPRREHSIMIRKEAGCCPRAVADAMVKGKSVSLLGIEFRPFQLVA
jgi:hypothetical protein